MKCLNIYNLIYEDPSPKRRASVASIKIDALPTSHPLTPHQKSKWHLAE